MALKLEAIPRSDAKLLAALLAFMKKERNDEGYAFYFDKGNNEALYLKYIKSGSAKEVNISSGTKRPLEALAALKNWNGMTPGLKAAKEEVRKMINADVMPRFERSAEYKAYQAAKK